MNQHKARLKQGRRKHKLYLALKKYGHENFDWNVLSVCKDDDELKNKEIGWIKFFNSFNRGYNMTIGGDTVSDDMRKKISKSLMGHEANYGHKISKINKGKLAGKKHPLYGKRGDMCKTSKKYIVTEPDGTEHFVHGLNHFVNTWEKDQLHTSALVSVARGKLRHYKQYTCRYDDREPSTTIPTGSTPQAIGGGNGERLNEAVI